MSLALRWGDEAGAPAGFIYLDAVTLYTQSYKGRVTNHPVDGGSNISDHFFRDNPVFKITAVITGVDISNEPSVVVDSRGHAPFNSQLQPTAVSVNSTDQSVLSKFIPDSIGQFLPSSTPEVIVDDPRDDVMVWVQPFLTDLMSGKVFNPSTGEYDPKIQLVSLYEYDRITLRTVVNNLVMTNISFREDANTGYGLYCDINFEQVTFVPLKKTTIPKDVQDSLKKKSSSKASKGKQDSQPQDVDGANAGSNAPKDTDPLRQARTNG